MTQDEKIQDIAVAMIRRSSMEPEEWQATVIGEIHPKIRDRLVLDGGELPLTSAFLAERSWYAFTTRRIVSHLDANTQSLNPANGITTEFGNFKGVGISGKPVQLAVISTTSGATIRFEYEAGRPSMAPIHAAKYWTLKHPILHKLLSSAERKSRV
jgi:hypothetical protein